MAGNFFNNALTSAGTETGASHRASVAFTMAQLFRGCQLLPLLAWKAAGKLETWQGRDRCQGKLLEGDLLELPNENTGLEALHFHREAK